MFRSWENQWRTSWRGTKAYQRGVGLGTGEGPGTQLNTLKNPHENPHENCHKPKFEKETCTNFLSHEFFSIRFWELFCDNFREDFCEHFREDSKAYLIESQLNKANGNLVPFARVRPPRDAHFGWAGSRMVPQQGSSPLHAAASRGHLEMVSILLEWGAGTQLNTL